MGKKMIDKMNALKEKFLTGGKKNGYDERFSTKFGLIGKNLLLMLSISRMPHATRG